MMYVFRRVTCLKEKYSETYFAIMPQTDENQMGALQMTSRTTKPIRHDSAINDEIIIKNKKTN